MSINQLMDFKKRAMLNIFRLIKYDFKRILNV